MEIPVSEARRRLFALFERAVHAEGEKIVIARRGRKQRAVLVSERYLEQLEARFRSKPPSDKPASGTPALHMAGSARIIGNPATVISEVRVWQGKLRREKQLSLNKESPRDASRRR